MRTWMKVTLVILSVVIVIGFIGLGSYYYYNSNFSKEDYENFDEEGWKNPLDDEKIVDNNSLYNLEDDLGVEQIYVTVLNDTDKTFKNMVLDNDRDGDTSTTLNILFETKKKMLNNGLYIKEPNGTIRIKGKSSQEAPQKSFKIELSGNAGLWNGQEVINLNKCYSDPLRIRSKLIYDYISLVNNLTSFQTSYVRLFIRDLSDGDTGAEFVDYGFYTQVEQPNKLFLKNHMLDENGHLYEAVNFNFSMDEDKIKLKDDNDYSKKDFEKVLDIKGSDDHSKILKLIETVNDYNMDINETMDTYFNEENYLTWMAINILFDNYNVTHENYIIYSPLNSNKWFFMPWDMDKTLGAKKERPDWQWGTGFFIDNVLHKRYLSSAGNIDKLTDKIEELSEIINEEQTSELLDRYYEILMANITKLPDFRHLSLQLEDFMAEYKELPAMTEIAKLRYEENIKKPTTFRILKYTKINDGLEVQWEPSLHFQGDSVAYDVQLSNTPEFTEIIYESLDVQGEKTVVKGVPSGTYYLKVTAKDSKGYTQYANTEYEDGSDKMFFGIMKIKF